MLVLSRRPDEKILLPTVPAVIKVISTQASHTRLGIDAPAHVPILREELCGDNPCLRNGSVPAGDSHPVRGRLHHLTLSLAQLRRQLADAGAAVRMTLDRMEQDLHALRGQLAPGSAAIPCPDLVLMGGAGV